MFQPRSADVLVLMTPQDKEIPPEKASDAEKVLFFFKDVAFSSASAQRRHTLMKGHVSYIANGPGHTSLNGRFCFCIS
ncbi:hypothetical protein ACFQ3N_00340 [Virgibacillus byunsanensis]|uniref:Uncharacterized protein n=1 Tax=Virgibacillus byunsanensis TaxID=570945 RepID=A0ABW3LER3_9BACI